MDSRHHLEGAPDSWKGHHVEGAPAPDHSWRGHHVDSGKWKGTGTTTWKGETIKSSADAVGIGPGGREAIFRSFMKRIGLDS